MQYQKLFKFLIPCTWLLSHAFCHKNDFPLHFPFIQVLPSFDFWMATKSKTYGTLKAAKFGHFGPD